MSTVKNDKLSIFIILDAFRWDYMNAEDTPTLTKLAEDGAYGHKLLSSSGFTQRSSIFTGTWPETTRNFTMFIYKPESSQYRYLRFFPFLKYFEFRVRKLDNLIRIILTKINRYFYRGRFFPPAYIPYEMLPLIGISEDNIPIFKPRAFGDIESLFDVFDRQDVKFEFLMHPLAAGNDDWVLKRLLATPLKNGVIFAQFSDSDAGIHVAGVGSQGAKDIIRDIDNRLKQICDEFDSRDQEYELILVGDHGMQNVQTRLDVHHHVSAALAEKGLTFSKDYLIFLSSTLTHFWWFNDDAECAIRELVETDFFLQNGFVLTDDLCKTYRIPLFDRQYGNLVWAANEGVLIFPDYFHRYKDYDAMHGYISHCDAMKGFALVYNNRKSYQQRFEQVDLIDICATIADSAGVDTPANNIGKSMLSVDVSAADA